MAARTESRRRRLLAYLDENRPSVIDEAQWHVLRSLLAPISEQHLRRLLASTGIPVEQPFAGVRQSSFEELEVSLVELERVYSRAVAEGDRAGARSIRRMVIRSKDRAKLAAQNPKLGPEKREKRREMAEWMLTWLENPGIFPVWVEVKKRARTG